MAVRVRFAPSPTGFLHLGGIRAAVFDYLFAKQDPAGAFILRIEDTDQSRFVEGATEAIAQSLHWLGVPPDEGVYWDEASHSIQEKGAYGPYTQSKRLDIYKKYADELLASGQAYRCFATAEELEEMRSAQQAAGQPPRYDGRHRDLDPAESDRRAAAGEKFVIRHKLPADRTVVFQDVVRGEISFQSNDLDDYVLLKSDGFPTYQLANVVDDHLMEITHVLRGDEWISSTPKNLLLYEAFGWTPPLFAHLPVILGPDGKKKLSKRDGAEPVLAYRDMGYLPEALVNVLAFVGWAPGDEREFFTHDELIQAFRLERVQRAGGILSGDRMDYVNGWYIRQLPVGEVAHHMLPYLEAAGYYKDGQLPKSADMQLDCEPGEYLLRIAGELQTRLKRFDETAALVPFFFERPVVSDAYRALLVPKKAEPETVMQTLRMVQELLESYAGAWTRDDLKDLLYDFCAKNDLKTGDVLWPVRALLTGEAMSPGAFEMLAILGKAESLARFDSVLK